MDPISSGPGVRDRLVYLVPKECDLNTDNEVLFLFSETILYFLYPKFYKIPISELI
jgi:hypothetical protein